MQLAELVHTTFSSKLLLAATTQVAFAGQLTCTPPPPATTTVQFPPIPQLSDMSEAHTPPTLILQLVPFPQPS
jgi:hypothetical protein